MTLPVNQSAIILPRLFAFKWSLVLKGNRSGTTAFGGQPSNHSDRLLLAFLKMIFNFINLVLRAKIKTRRLISKIWSEIWPDNNLRETLQGRPLGISFCTSYIRQSAAGRERRLNRAHCAHSSRSFIPIFVFLFCLIFSLWLHTGKHWS